MNPQAQDSQQLQTGITRADIIFPAVAIVLILVCSFLLARQLFGVGGAAGTEVVGEIYYKDKVAERKYAKQALWGGLENGAPVYNYDTIRTETAAEAVIELKDGTRIEMDQNTMIVIVVTEEAAEIDFARGGIRTVRDDGGTGGLSIKSDQGTVDLSSGDVALSKDEGDDLTVTLKKGEASVSDSDGRTEELGENQQAQVGDELNLQSLIELVAPAANARAFVKGGAVSFRWGEADGPVIFELANDRGFTKGVRRSTVAANQIRLTLADGLYYWRVRQANVPQPRKSEARRLTVVQARPLRLFAPAEGAQLGVPGGAKAPVNFSWEAGRFASGYRLLLGRSRDLSGAQEVGTQTTNLLQRLEPGEYYWKVVTNSLNASAVTESPVRRFTVQVAAALKPPRPVSPRDGEDLNRAVAAQKGVTFNWLADRGLKDYQVQVSRDANFQQIVYDGRSDRNFVSWQAGQSVQAGLYYWRVRASSTEYSAVRRFAIGESTKIPLVAPAADALVDLATATRPGVSFGWRKTGFAGTYRVTVARNAALNQDARTAESNRLSARVSGLKPGKYFWKVALLDRSGQAITESDVRAFVIGSLLPEPRAVFPRQGNVVEMGDKESLDFAWEAARGAGSYRLEFVRVDGGSTKTLSSQNLKGTRYSFRDLPKLREGLYEWRISAEAGSGADARRSRTVTTRFRVRLPRIDKPTFVGGQEEFFLPGPGTENGGAP
ncbi:MAG: FecR family protein [bacterium]|nr:FecR family protein [bacterium]